MKKQLKINKLNSTELSKQKMNFVKGGKAPKACMDRCGKRGGSLAGAISELFWK